MDSARWLALSKCSIISSKATLYAWPVSALCRIFNGAGHLGPSLQTPPPRSRQPSGSGFGTGALMTDRCQSYADRKRSIGSRTQTTKLDWAFHVALVHVVRLW